MIRILVCISTGKPEENLNLLFSKFMTPRTPTIEYHCNIEEHQCYSAVSFAQLQSCIILPSDLCTVPHSGHRRGPSLVVTDAPIESKCDLTTSMGQPPSVTVDRIVSMRANYSDSSGHDSFLIRIAHCDTFRQLTSVQIRTWVAYLDTFTMLHP